MTAEQIVADAFRVVALRLEQALERGQRSKRLTADDLLETLLAIADRIESPVAEALEEQTEPPF